MSGPEGEKGWHDLTDPADVWFAIRHLSRVNYHKGATNISTVINKLEWLIEIGFITEKEALYEQDRNERLAGVKKGYKH